MKNPKEAAEAATGFTKGQKDATALKGQKTSSLKVCNPSVCVGNQKPTSCVCPTEK